MSLEKQWSFRELKIRFQKNHHQELRAFYRSSRDGFMDWAHKRFDTDDDTLKDVFQDAVIALYNRVVSDRVDDIEAVPEAYLFGIAKNLMLKKSIKLRKMILSDNVTDFYREKSESQLIDFYHDQHDRKKLKDALARLNDSCRKIIELFYYNRYSMEAIAEEFGYDNTNVVKSRKYQCMKELKSIFKK